MAASDTGVVDSFLVDYAEAVNRGFGFIEGDVQYLASIMITISLVMAGLFWALKGEDVMVPFLRKVLLIGFFAFLINNWTYLMGVISSSFVDLGIKAGGGSMNVSAFYSPSVIASLGIRYWSYFGETIDTLTGPVAFFQNIVDITILFITGIVVIVAFFIMALQVFVTLVMFKLVTLAAFVLVPFGLLKHTNFMSERALGLVVAYGLKFFTLALVISIGYTIFDQLEPPDILTMKDALSITLAALALMMLAMHAPAVASELITGGPQIGAGAMGASILGSAALAGASAYLGGKAVSGGAKLASNPLIKAASAGQITVNGQPMSSKNSASSLNVDGSMPTFHAQGGKEGGAKKSAIGKKTIAGSVALSSMARSDSSGGISSTGSNNQDEGE